MKYYIDKKKNYATRNWMTLKQYMRWIEICILFFIEICQLLWFKLKKKICWIILIKQNYNLHKVSFDEPSNFFTFLYVIQLIYHFQWTSSWLLPSYLYFEGTLFILRNLFRMLLNLQIMVFYFLFMFYLYNLQSLLS